MKNILNHWLKQFILVVHVAATQVKVSEDCTYIKNKKCSLHCVYSPLLKSSYIINTYYAVNVLSLIFSNKMSGNKKHDPAFYRCPAGFYAKELHDIIMV